VLGAQRWNMVCEISCLPPDAVAPAEVEARDAEGGGFAQGTRAADGLPAVTARAGAASAGTTLGGTVPPFPQVAACAADAETSASALCAGAPGAQFDHSDPAEPGAMRAVDGDSGAEQRHDVLQAVPPEALATLAQSAAAPASTGGQNRDLMDRIVSAKQEEAFGGVFADVDGVHPVSLAAPPLGYSDQRADALRHDSTLEGL
jgi:hypothetical protein